MPDYSQAKIYKIIGGDDDEFYIGSTVEKYLSNRMGGHRKMYKAWKEGKTHFITSFTLFDKYGIENCRIELIEMFPCACVEELRKQEGEYIRKETCINKRIEGRTKKQYYEEHKEDIGQRQQQYYQDNKEEFKQNQMKRYELNKEEINARKAVKYTCECGTVLSIQNKAVHNRTKKHLAFLQK
jgi:hypothetical protein